MITDNDIWINNLRIDDDSVHEMILRSDSPIMIFGLIIWGIDSVHDQLILS
jgi:hypothetical protein